MKKDFNVIVTGASCAVALLCLVNTWSIKNDMQRLQNDIRNVQQNVINVNSDINNISATFSYALEQKTKIYSDFDFQAVNPDFEAGSCTLKASVSVKEFSPSSTKASLIINGKSHPMVLSGSKYILEETIPLFEDITIESICLKDGENIRQDKINYYLSPLQSAPVFIEERGIPSTSSRTDGPQVKISVDGPLEIYFPNANDLSSFKEAYFVIKNDDQEIQRLPIDLSEEGQEKYIKKSDPHVPDDRLLHFYQNTVSYYMESFNTTIPIDSSLSLIFQLKTEKGITFSYLLEKTEYSKRGSTSSDRAFPIKAQIYNEDGKLLYDANKITE